VVEDNEDDIAEGKNKKKTKEKEKEVIVPVQILSDTVTNLSAEFNKQYPELKMSRTSLWKNIPEYFSSKGKKKTDMCHICEYGKMAKKLLAKEQNEGVKLQVNLFCL
jgi:hypothetical protein